MHVVRSPVARAAHGDRSHARYRGSAARGPHLAFPRPLRLGTIFAGCPVVSDTQQKWSRGQPTAFRPDADRVQLISAVWDLTAPVKIYIIIIVHIHRNEHEFYCVKSLWPRTPPRSHGASDCVLDPRIRLHYEYFQSILENLSRGDRLADAQNRADRIIDACRKAATRGVPRKSLDLSVEFPSARRLWRVAPSDGTGLAMMASCFLRPSRQKTLLRLINYLQ